MSAAPLKFPQWVIKIASTWLAKDSKGYTYFLKHQSHLSKAFFFLTILFFPLFSIYSWLRIAVYKLFRIKPTVLWTPTPILNIAESSKLLNELNYKSRTLVFNVYFITEKFDANLQTALLNPAVNWWMPNVLFLWSLLFFDIYHFYYDGGLWSGMNIIPKAKWLELPLLRLAGKRIIVSAYGADVRTKRRDEMWQRWNLCVECPEPGRHCICNDYEGAKRAKYCRDWGNSLLAMGDMHDYVYGSNPYFVYWPIDTRNIKYVEVEPDKTKIIVAHSPNHRHFKGTRFIESAISSLQKKGYAIGLDIIEKVSNEEAKRRYAAADIIFAQCIAGWFGFTEIEGMAIGKPVISYIRDPERYLSHVPNWPAISVTPDDLEVTLEKLINNPEWRVELGRRGRNYVENCWSFSACAPHYDKLHKDIWENNKLFTTLRNKWLDFWRGDLKIKVGSVSKANQLGEFLIWTDPFVALDRVSWGLYGRPSFDHEGYLQISLNKKKLRHIGVSALHSLDCFHAMLLNPTIEQHRERFIREARLINNVILEENAKRIAYLDEHNKLIADGGLLEIPSHVVSYRILALPVLLRAKQTDADFSYDTAINALIKLFQVSHDQGGFIWKDAGDKMFVLDGINSPDLKMVTSLLFGIFALYEYSIVHVNCNEAQWTNELLTNLLLSLKNLTKSCSLQDIISFDHIGCDFKMDEYYFIIYGFKSIYKITQDKVFKQISDKFAKQFYRYRIKSFLKLNSPI